MTHIPAPKVVECPACGRANHADGLVCTTPGCGTVLREVTTMCQWFALCDHPATGTMSHPVLGAVPICDRCRMKVEGL